MNEKKMRQPHDLPSRRAFLKQATAAAVGTSLAASLDLSRTAYAAGSDELKLGLIGCGGRGTGAAAQALTADKGTRLVAMGDAFPDRLSLSLNSLRQQTEIGKRVDVEAARQFIGFDAYQQVIASPASQVITHGNRRPAIAKPIVINSNTTRSSPPCVRDA